MGILTKTLWSIFLNDLNSYIFKQVPALPDVGSLLAENNPMELKAKLGITEKDDADHAKWSFFAIDGDRVEFMVIVLLFKEKSKVDGIRILRGSHPIKDFQFSAKERKVPTPRRHQSEGPNESCSGTVPVPRQSTVPPRSETAAVASHSPVQADLGEAGVNGQVEIRKGMKRSEVENLSGYKKSIGFIQRSGHGFEVLVFSDTSSQVTFPLQGPHLHNSEDTVVVAAKD